MLKTRGGLTTIKEYSLILYFFKERRGLKTEKTSSKMYLDIVKELRLIIKEEGIKTGEKLPSERELAERLSVGRSTVREALRSLELLGLIETRRGEGTFLVDFQKHQLVEVLADFIMQQPHSVSEVLQTRRMHEIDAIMIICSNQYLQQSPVWNSLLCKLQIEECILREDIIREMIIATGNRLSLKIWFLLKQYSKVPFGENTSIREKSSVEKLLNSLITGDENRAIKSYRDWIDIVEGKSEEEIKNT